MDYGHRRSSDAGTRADAAAAVDAQPSPDSGPTPDASGSPDSSAVSDAAVPDTGSASDASVSADSGLVIDAGALDAGNPNAIAVNIDADPVLTFPAKDLSLFGEAPSARFVTLEPRWITVSGPAPVSFSAPWALATTASFSAPGTYVLRLTVVDGGSSGQRDITVTVNPASSQTAFYVDPSFAGLGDGSATSPWTNLPDDESGPEWTSVNAALGSGPVIIYFPARQAGADQSQELNTAIFVHRTDTGSHRLTLDGMSKYNTNVANPSWADYSGSSRFRVNMTSSYACCFSIGWTGPSDGGAKQHHVTMRGFEVTGRGARITWGGDHDVLEHIWSHDVTDLGATVQFDGAVTYYPECRDVGRSHDITIRGNVIERGIGEGIYIAGTYTSTVYGGCPSYGNTHWNILVEGNVVRDPGWNGDEGDGMDLKGGLQNVTVRGNVFANMHNAGEGGAIPSEGAFGMAPTNYLFEGNTMSGGAGSPDATSFSGGIVAAGQNGIIIRNNLIYGTPGACGIYLDGEGGFPILDAVVYNNTLYGNAAGICFFETHGATLRNNLLVGNGNGTDPQMGFGSSDGLDSDYNLLAPTGSGFAEGAHSITPSSTAGIFASPSSGDFRLVLGSPAVDRGEDLSSTGFAVDSAGVSRPQGAGWDIGAYELVSP
jgi:parallel beta-helix repeat protein